MSTIDKTAIYFDTIERSVFYDNETFLWFKYFLLSKQVRRHYGSLSFKSLALLNVATNVLILTAIASLLLMPLNLIICSISMGISLVLCLIIKRSFRKEASLRAREIAEIDYPNLDLFEETLYLISEELSKKFNCPSLVDLINILEQFKISAILIAIILTIFLPGHFGLQMRGVMLVFTFTIVYLSCKTVWKMFSFRNKQ